MSRSCRLALVLCALLTRTANAQIVDVQRLLAADPKEGVAGGVDGSVDVRRGDVEVTSVAMSGNVRWRRENLAVFALVQAERASTGGVSYLDKDLEHVRFRWIGGRVQAETFFQHDRDLFRRRELRALWGVGPRFVAYQSTTASFTQGAAVMAELERLSTGPYSDSGRTTIRQRGSLYASGRRRIGDMLSAGQTLYLQPRVDAIGDLRALSESELLVSLGPRISLRLTAVIAHDSRPPDQVARTQTAIKTAFHLDLGAAP